MFEIIKKMLKRRNKKMTTLEEVRKAYEDLSDNDKEKFHQSIADRIHESVGEQEKKDGTKDEQSAADREHEALAEEHAQGDGDVKELAEFEDETDDEDEHEKKQEEKHDFSEEKDEEHDERLNKIENDIAAIKDMLSRKNRESEQADKTVSDKLNDLARKYE